jgi:hypothetical protein
MVDLSDDDSEVETVGDSIFDQLELMQWAWLVFPLRYTPGSVSHTSNARKK